MARWILTYPLGPITITLNVSNAIARARPQLSADFDFDIALQEVARQLKLATGMRGHTLPSACTASELHAALRGTEFTVYAPVQIEGQELVAPDPQFDIAAAEAAGVHF